MIIETRLDLNVPYAEKEEAKALGALWDPSLRTWYVLAGTDLAGFDARWLPSEIVIARDGGEPTDTGRGISLSELLTRVRSVVAKGLPESVWVRAEISEISTSKNGNLYLQLVEQSERGNPLGRIKGIIWSGRAVGINAKFAAATGEGLRTDIKILCLAQVRFEPLFGLDLIIEDVDPSYTLGDLAAKLARIRKRLADEGIATRNQLLPSPVEYLRIAVISPETSAGLGDFRREADRLHHAGLCEFRYFGATFQGVDAPSSIRTALNEVFTAHRERAFDAVTIIRGGGSATDLAWLNDLELARMICLSVIPVFTGIGHERDSTVLDEVAHRRFDTPSKVALHISSTIRDYAVAAMAAMDRIRLQVARVLGRERTALETQSDRIQAGVRAIFQRAEDGCDKSLALVRTSATARVEQERMAMAALSERVLTGCLGSIRKAAEGSEEAVSTIRTAARFHHREACRSLDSERQRLANLSSQIVCDAEVKLGSMMDSVVHRSEIIIRERSAEVDRGLSMVDLKARAATASAMRMADQAAEHVRRASGSLVEKASEQIAGFMRLTIGLGPRSTLRRGFSIAKSATGRPISSREVAAKEEEFTVEFHDGAVRVSNLEFERWDES